MMKKSLLCFSLLWILFGCTTPNPTISIQHVEFIHIGYEKVDLQFDLQVANPTSSPVHLLGFDYNLLLGEKEASKGYETFHQEIGATQIAHLKVPLTLPLHTVYSSALDFLMHPQNPIYEAILRFNFQIPTRGNVKVPFTQEGTIPLLNESSSKDV